MRPDPLPGRAVRLPVADRRRPVADRRRHARRRSAARPRSAPRCTAATSSRSRSASTSCGCWSSCSATDAALRETAAHDLAADDLLVGGAGIGVLAVRLGGDHEPELGSAERVQLGLALDQFRRTLPRRHALSTVGPRPRRDRRRRARPRRAAARSRDARRRRSTGVVIGYSGQHEHPREAHRAHEHARLALRVASALPEHPLAGRAGTTSAPTACWRAPPRRRTRAS